VIKTGYEQRTLMNVVEKTALDLFAPPKRSYMVGHWIFRGREFKRNDARTNRFRLADHLGIPYIVVNIKKSKDRCHLLLSKGFEFDNKRWIVADGWIRKGDGGTFLLFPSDALDAPRTPAQYKEALNRRGVFGSEADHRKFEKYFKRDQAPYMASFSGPITEESATSVTAGLVFRSSVNGKLNVRNTFFRMPKIDERLEFAVDGRLYVSTGCASLMVGREVKDGEGFIGHVMMPGRFYKGIIEARSDMKGWDFWLYAGKKQLRSLNDTVTVTFLSELHVAPIVYSDIQSVIALDYVESLPDYALRAMFGFQDALNDERKMNDMVDRIAQSIEANDLESDDSDREAVWSLIQAQRAGLPLTCLPVLRTKLLRFFTTRMVNMSKFRVPLPDWCLRRYLSVDRFAFDDDGNIDLNKAVLHDKECLIPGDGAEQVVSVQRQPIAGPQEQAFLTATSKPEYGRLNSKCPFVYISIDVLEDVLRALGGGDLDDPSIIRKDSNEVDRLRARFAGHHYHVSESGVEVEATPASPAVEVNPFTSRRQARVNQDLTDPMGRLRKLINTLIGTRGDLSIGEVSNYIMIDITNQNEGRYVDPLLPRCTSNLEGVIDSSQHVMKDGELAKNVLVTEIAAFKESIPCVEKQLYYRLPEAIRGNVEVFEGQLTRTRDLIEKRIAQWKEDMDLESIDKIFSILPLHLVEVSSSKEAVNLMFEMRRFAKAKMDENIAIEIPLVTGEFEFDGFDVANTDVKKAIEAKAAVNAYKTTEEELYVRYNKHALRMQAVAEWLKQSWIAGEKFTARRTDGTGFLAGNHTIRWMIEAWRLLGTADCAPITLLSDAILTQRQGRDSHKHALNTQVSSVSLRFGWQKKGLAIDDPEVVAAKSKAGQHGTLVAGKLGKLSVWECHLDDDSLFGIVPVAESNLLDGRVSGTVQVHPSQAFGMLFAFDKEPVTPAPVADTRNTFAVVNGLELECDGNVNDPRNLDFQAMGLDNDVVTLFSCTFLNAEDGDWEDAVAVVRGEHREIPTANAGYRLPEDISAAGLEIVGWITRGQVQSVLDKGDLLYGLLAPGGPFSLKVEVL